MKLKLITLLCFLSATTLRAGLSLQINFETEEFALVGTDTGIPADFSGDGIVRWEFENNFSPGVGFSGGTIFTSSASSPRDLHDATFAIDDDGFESVWFGLYLSDASTTTIDGTGEFVPIGSFFPHAESAILELVGKQIPLEIGSGFEPLSVVAVPEPRAYAVLMGVGGLFFALKWRNRRQ